MNEKRISDRCQKLNAYVNDLKNKEIERLNTVKNNTSDIVMMFEYNKDYFKHFILYAILINSYIRLFKIKEPHLWN